MKTKNLKKKKKAKAIAARKKAGRTPQRLVHRERKDLELKDYLMEDHPELGLPLDGAKHAMNAHDSRAARR